MGWSKDQVLDLYPEEVEPLAKAILNLDGASKLGSQIDFAEAVGVPWMKSFKTKQWFNDKQSQRAKLLTGDNRFEMIQVESPAKNGQNKKLLTGRNRFEAEKPQAPKKEKT